MVLDLKQIFEGSLLQKEVSGAVDLSKEKIAGQTIFPRPAQVFGSISNTTGIITLAYTVLVDLETTCDLCLTPVVAPWQHEFRHILVESVMDEENVSFLVCASGQLDFSELVSNDVFLELPSRFVCTPDCKGLCDRCGANQNEDPCHCTATEVDPRFAKLKQLFE